MNLTTDPWIPIVWQSGKPDKVSLLDAFRRGEEIRDLAVRPHERIALMRLLICVAQAALDGPKSRADWRASLPLLPDAVARYLDKHRPAFELLGPGPRFLQVAGIESTKQVTEGKGNDPAKLNLDMASGNSSTLFDTAGGTDRGFTEAHLALMLLTFQCFSPGGLLSECIWSGKRTKKAGNAVAPCLSGRMLHTFVFDRGNLLRQVHGNLVPVELLRGVELGRPVWERMPGDGGPTTPAAHNALQTHLGRLVPASRAIWLSDDLRSVVWGCGIEYPPYEEDGWRDPFATIIVDERDKKRPRKPLAASLERAAWRELHSIVSLSTSDRDGLGGAIPLSPAAEENRACDIWTGGMVDKQKAKIVDAVEAVLHVPSGMFAKPVRKRYQEGVKCADVQARQLRQAVSKWHAELGDDFDRAEVRKRGMEVKRKASTHYWTAAEQSLSHLLAVVEHPDLLGPDPSRPQWHATAWGKALARAAREAYELACPHETPRQLKAYALGLQALFASPAADAPEEDTATEDAHA
jgi:CRISPR system Cascade subunit CasA